MTNWFTYEFQAKHFMFRDCPQSRFYTTQWCDNVWAMLAIKAFFLLYWFAWFIVSVVSPNSEYWIFLTNWGVIVLVIYFLTSFAVVTHGVATREAWQTTVSRTSAVNRVSRSETVPVVLESEKLRWFHIFIWMFQTVALDGAFIITILYWILLSPNASVVSVNTHAINTVLMLLDLFLNNIPIRILHFIHTAIFFAIYSIFSVILYATGYNVAIYPVLNWGTGPGLSAGLCVGVTLVGSFVVHCLMFGLYHFRWWIARKTVLKEERGATNVTLAMEADNPAFEKP